MSKPTFSILLPVKGRANLVCDALTSVLRQTFNDFEVIVSNNGADPQVRDALSPLLGDSRICYLEQAEVLSMPEHWERLSRLAIGQYQIVVPDRSVLLSNALATIADLHACGGVDAEIVSWSWDLFHTEAGMLESVAKRSGGAKVIDSNVFAISAFGMKTASLMTILPRGLNSSVLSSLIGEIRNRVGSAFRPLSPDFSFAYACLMMRNRFTNLAQPLSISQGLTVSNGGNAYKADGTSYLATLCLDEPIRYSPIKALLVENGIAEDFFTACYEFNRHDLLAQIDRSALFLKCITELEAKYAAAILTNAQITKLADAVEDALASEDTNVQSKVIQMRKTRQTHLQLFRQKLRCLFGDRIEHLRPLLLHLKGEKHFASALEAAEYLCNKNSL